MGVWRFFNMFKSSSMPHQHSSPTNLQKESADNFRPPVRQRALILYGPRQSYKDTSDLPTPTIQSDRELIVRNSVIGLNPIDWKAPDFNFGIPQLPYVSGREYVGEVLTLPQRQSRLKRGDQILVISTDYRDLRKAAFQQYAVANDFNVARLPTNISPEAGAGVGVAFLAAAIILGVNAGVNFNDILDGPDLLRMVRSLNPEQLPEDIRAECLNGISISGRAREGDYIAIWGGSSMTAFMITQLARLAGLKVISILDSKKHALTQLGSPDVVVDSHDPQRAIDIVRATTNNSLRFGVDTLGRTTAETLLQALGPANPKPTSSPDQTDKDNEPKQLQTPPSTPSTPDDTLPLSAQTDLATAHLIGLTGLPKTSPPPGTTFHNVPIKLFHEVPEFGEALMIWLERLLAEGLLLPPRVVGVERGLESVNGALDRMRRGEVSGGRVVVRVD